MLWKIGDRKTYIGLIEWLAIGVVIFAAILVLWRMQHPLSGYFDRPDISRTGSLQASLKPTQHSNTQQIDADTWQTYTSSEESSTFKYPSDWVVTKPALVSSDSSNSDQIGIASPSGAITITWASGIIGFGNEHSASYPLNTVLDKSPVPGAPGHFVVSGITTLDGSTYHPWMAVQDSNGITTSGVQGNLATFTSTHALNPTTRSATGLLFATCGARTTQNTPAMTKDQATAFLKSAEAQQANEILLSFSERN